ncbi:MAG: PQQ-dependent sugar dehydrogenase [Pseudomonadota bacterium]|nr:PQQ-dependent sugar dehydrogenase [Pseudomonadota bacterium]
MKNFLRRHLVLPLVATLVCVQPAFAQPQPGVALGTGPWVFKTFPDDYLKVSVLARGLNLPFGVVFIPGTATEQYPLGDMLFTERNVGTVRYYTQGKLVDTPVVDMKTIFPMEQLFDIELHPDFERNKLIYFTYVKEAPRPDGSEGYWVTNALARGRYTGPGQLTDIEEIYEAEAWSGNIGGASSRLHFLADGTLLFGVSHRIDLDAPQSLQSDIGKILRLNDDGSVPRDNPFIGVEGASPQIYAWGIRSVMDFTTHPETGEIWEVENGPQGGDEVNILRPGLNYGWPIATFGRDYDGKRFNQVPWVEGTEPPFIHWAPSITVSSLEFYTGDEFPNWKGNLFVTSMLVGRMPNTGHLQRIVLNSDGELSREQLLTELKQRIRYVRQGPDGLLYVLTDMADGALLRLEPSTAEEAALFAGATFVENAAPANEALTFEGADCQACHRSEAALLGPSWRDIANRYEASDATIATLAGKIIEGGSGQWGDSPMSPHPTLTLDAAKDMVRQILALRAN